MAEATYRVSGTMLISESWKPYEKTVRAAGEKQAVERVYTLFGSKHRLKRRNIRVERVELVPGV